jgi:hypothetical protein
MFATNKFQTIISTASGLYCAWIPANETPNAPLVCIWIDPRMTAFESAWGATQPGFDTTPLTLHGAAGSVEEPTDEPPGTRISREPALPFAA